MSTGISMSSVNKIKELAESRDYSLALDILEHQDLTKSLSPQFIRICGDVYYENGRYREARAALVKAHSMAPMGNKIIYSLIRLYLAMGFYTLVNTYYDIYNFNRSEKDAGAYRIEYLIARAKRKSYKELYGILISANEIDTNDIWDFEMLVLYAAMQNTEKLKMEAEMFCATYKSSPYLADVDRLLDGSYDIEEKVYCFPETEQTDDAPEQEETRELEQKALESDDLRMHPKDPKITLMVDDREPVSNSMKFKQMLIKSKEKKEEKKLLKQEKKEQQDESQKKEKRFRFGRVSKKDEEAFESAIAKQTEAVVDKEKLLDVIMQQDGQDHADAASEREQQEEREEEEVQEAVAETQEEQAENEAERNADDLFDAEIDNFDIPAKDDYDTVFMVDPEAFDDGPEAIAPESEEAEPKGAEPKPEEIEPEPEETESVPEELVEVTEEEAETPEYAETAETAERLEEEQEIILTERENTPEPETSASEQFDIDVAIQSLDDYTFEPEEPDFEEPEESVLEESVEEPEEPVFEESESEESASSEKEPEESTSPEEEPEPLLSEDKVDDILKKPDFPVFRSSLFPNYHSGEPPVISPEPNPVDIKQEYDRKMSENLKKEEDLISEADELLARLGIELGTKYGSNTDYFHMYEDSVANDIEPETTDMPKTGARSISDDAEPMSQKDRKHAKDKKYKLKNNEK